MNPHTGQPQSYLWIALRAKTDYDSKNAHLVTQDLFTHLDKQQNLVVSMTCQSYACCARPFRVGIKIVVADIKYHPILRVLVTCPKWGSNPRPLG